MLYITSKCDAFARAVPYGGEKEIVDAVEAQGEEMVKALIRIMNEYIHGPIWTYDPEDMILTDDYPLVVEDPEIKEIEDEIAVMYDSYFEFDSHDVACWFNEPQMKADKDKMLELLGKLNARLEEINDGSFEVIDEETPRYKSME